jgi:LysM repeat protein
MKIGKIYYILITQALFLVLACNGSDTSELASTTPELPFPVQEAPPPIPTPSPTPTPGAAVSESGASDSSQNSNCAYTVQQGETLLSLGRRYNVNPGQIAQVNKLANADYIYAGQTLYVPCARSGQPYPGSGPVPARSGAGYDYTGYYYYYGPYYYYGRYSYTCGYHYNCR